MQLGEGLRRSVGWDQLELWSGELLVPADIKDIQTWCG